MRRGWAERLAPLRPAGAVLGVLTPAWVKRTGLPGNVAVYCGLHDSNAALLAARRLDMSVDRDVTTLSTGTWFIAMRSPLPNNVAGITGLTETRDCLINVDVQGAPVPSARFMGGREIELLSGAHAGGTANTDWPDPTIALRCVGAGEFILPTAVSGVGPFPNAKRAPEFIGPSEETSAKVLLYAAMVADVSLDLIGSTDTLVVEGRFSRSPIFVSALAALRPHTAVLVSDEEHGGVARGAPQPW